MTPEIALTLTIISVVIVLFTTEKLRVDVIALLVLLTLALTGLVDSQDAFSGFASPAVITVGAVYVISGGLFKTGVADILAQRILKLAGKGELRLTGVIMAACGTMSAFMNNIGATAVLLPAVGGISRKTGISLSRLLIPLAFASLMGGNMTLIGTPPNVLATGILAERGLPTFRFFDFAPMGLIVFATGIGYMLLVGRHLLPARETAEDLQATYKLRKYVSEVRVLAGSPLVGRTLYESRLGADFDLTVVAVIRDEVMQTAANRDMRLRSDDLLLVRGALDKLIAAQRALGLTIEADQPVPFKFEEQGAIIEATLSPRSGMMGRSLRQIRFRDRYGFTALAIWRHGEIITKRLRDVRLQFGDALILHGSSHALRPLQSSAHFLVLEPVSLDLRRQEKVPLAIGIMVAVLVLASLDLLSISIAMVCGALLMVLTGCLSMDEAYESIEWRSLFLIGGMLPLGLAMEATGTAQFLADLMIDLVGGLGPLGALAGVYVLASLITAPISNAVATVLIAPIAIDVALGLGANPQSFVLATVIAASTSFLTPVGHQANVLVFGPGGYRFFDYTRVGAPLNLAIFTVTMIFLPIFWPLFP